MKSLIIHIGAHKTGTTMIQSCFDKNSAILRESGVIYPRSNWYHHSQHRLAFALKGLKDPSDGSGCDLQIEAEALSREIASAEAGSKIFISSEEFFSVPLDRVQDFHDQLQCDNVKIVAFVRRPDNLFISMYNQNTKDPGNKFFRPVSALLEDPASIHPDMYMHRCVANWASVFGYENLFLHCYEDACPLSVILRILDLPAGIISAPARINESVPAAVAEVMRISKAFDIPVELRSELYGVASRVFFGWPKLTLSDHDRRKIMKSVQNETDGLFAMVGKDNPYAESRMAPTSEETLTMRPVQLLVRIMEELLKERSRF